MRLRDEVNDLLSQAKALEDERQALLEKVKEVQGRCLHKDRVRESFDSVAVPGLTDVRTVCPECGKVFEYSSLFGDTPSWERSRRHMRVVK